MGLTECARQKTVEGKALQGEGMGGIFKAATFF